MSHPEHGEVLAALSRSADGPAALSRRRFLQGVLGMTGAAVAGPALRLHQAGAGTLGPSDGVLVVVTLGGGNDALNTVVPASGANRDAYERLRGDLALPVATLLPLDDTRGLHPELPRLAARTAAGEVAVIDGVGHPEQDLSHFESMAAIMAGSASSSRTTGWLGRFLDGLPGRHEGFGAVTFSSSVPLHLVGADAPVTALPSAPIAWGASPTEPWEVATVDALRALGSAPTGLGRWGDALAGVHGDALDRAARLAPVLAHPPVPDGLERDMVLAARLVNADLGARVVAVSGGGWDTHAAQAGTHEALLDELDRSLQAFDDTLDAANRSRVVVLVLSEFGRRVAANGSAGTDHGTSGTAFLLGANVRGGSVGEVPSLAALTRDGNAPTTLDIRSVYATLLDGWLGADAATIVGGGFDEQLDLLVGPPGS